jgi:hypothetical protein
MIVPDGQSAMPPVLVMDELVYESDTTVLEDDPM